MHCEKAGVAMQGELGEGLMGDDDTCSERAADGMQSYSPGLMTVAGYASTLSKNTSGELIASAELRGTSGPTL